MTTVERMTELLRTIETELGAAPSPELSRALQQVVQLVVGVISENVEVVRPALDALGSVMATIRGSMEGMEAAAQKVLDHTEALERTRDALPKIIERLRASSKAEGRSADIGWREAAAACEELRGPLTAIVSAMEFQDMTAQQLSAAVDLLDGQRRRMGNLLNVIGVPIMDADVPTRRTPKVGEPGLTAYWRQELADRLVREFQSMNGFAAR